MKMITAAALFLLCLSVSCNASAPTIKGVWLPIQAIPGFPEWNDFAAAEAAAAAQALMSVPDEALSKPVPTELLCFLLTATLFCF